MKDQSKTKQALIQELVSLKQKIEELEQSESEWKKEKEELKKSEARFHSYFDLPLHGIAITSPETGWIEVNDRICSLMGYSRDEMVRMTWSEMTHPDDLAANLEQFNRVLSGQIDQYTMDKRFIRKDGKVVWTNLSAGCVRKSDGSVDHMVALVEDITDHKRAEEALRESESLSKSLIDYMHDAMIILDWDGSILFANRAAARIIEFERPEEFVGHNMIEYLHPDSLQKAAEDLEAVMAGKMGFRSEYQLYSVTGRHIWVESIGGKILFRNASVNLVCIRDITERKQAEEELLRTLESLRKAVGATIQVMVSAVEARDPYTAGHQIRSADLARTIATEMGLPQGTIDAIRMAGSIHDIGKLYVPSELLTKPSRLTDIEFSLIKEHSRRGYEMLKDVESPWPLAEIIYQHHERMNGTGYPRNLKGDDILMEARILAISDVVESMGSHRPYRPSLGIVAALEEIEKNRGTLYDTGAVDACLRVFREKGYQLQ
jgi:PAS domain S-box-containing protein